MVRLPEFGTDIALGTPSRLNVELAQERDVHYNREIRFLVRISLPQAVHKAPIFPGKPHMTNYDGVKKALEAQLEELLQRAAGIEDSLSTPGSSDWEENAVESEDDEVLAGVGSLTKAEIVEIRLALNLIETGKYGKCTACGAEISKERLAAMPYATKCIRCA